MHIMEEYYFEDKVRLNDPIITHGVAPGIRFRLHIMGSSPEHIVDYLGVGAVSGIVYFRGVTQGAVPAYDKIYWCSGQEYLEYLYWGRLSRVLG